MAEPVSNINDAGSPLSSGDDKPQAAGEAPQPPVLPGMPTDTEHQLPQADRRSGLQSAAERVGGAVGSAVGSMRRGRLRVVSGRGTSAGVGLGDTAQNARERISDIADTAGEKFSDWKETAQDKVDMMRHRAGRTMSSLARTTRHRVYDARIRARHLSSEYPVQTILGFGALAFIVGFTLRIWRSNGD